jgi:hypothetical protein
MDQENLLSWLKEGIVEVSFNKKDGSSRLMKCTLAEDLVQPPKGKETRKKKEGLLSVWSIDDSGWRSFYIDSIKSTRFIPR